MAIDYQGILLDILTYCRKLNIEFTPVWLREHCDITSAFPVCRDRQAQVFFVNFDGNAKDDYLMSGYTLAYLIKRDHWTGKRISFKLYTNELNNFCNAYNTRLCNRLSDEAEYQATIEEANWGIEYDSMPGILRLYKEKKEGKR